MNESRTSPHLWFQAGSTARLTVTVPAGAILDQTLAILALAAQVAQSNELLRFTYDLTDPETGERIAGAARLLLEHLPDPRENPDAQNPSGT